MVNYEQALDLINQGAQVARADVQGRDLDRVIWVAEWHEPGCWSESVGYGASKADAISTALSFFGEDIPRGALSDLRHHGRTHRVIPGAYVSRAITTVSRTTLREVL
jgi:hypothetical protein